MLPKKPSLSIIGLGYVGLPLALEFGKITATTGFDTNTDRIEELRGAHDRTLESSADEFKAATYLSFTHNTHDIEHSDVYIVTVPTPIDSSCQPDLSFLEEASRLLGQVVSNGNVIIFESTVFPGCTEENCIPIIAWG